MIKAEIHQSIYSILKWIFSICLILKVSIWNEKAEAYLVNLIPWIWFTTFHKKIVFKQLKNCVFCNFHWYFILYQWTYSHEACRYQCEKTPTPFMGDLAKTTAEVIWFGPWYMVCVGDLGGARGGLNNIFEFTVVQLVFKQ